LADQKEKNAKLERDSAGQNIRSPPMKRLQVVDKNVTSRSPGSAKIVRFSEGLSRLAGKTLYASPGFLAQGR
jgi:hypothetical protein